MRKMLSDLERVQKSAMKVILQEDYGSYNQALKRLELEDLSVRREEFAKNV